MKVNYSDEAIVLKQPSIFLAGPTPRSPDVQSWRPDALKILADLEYTGTVYVPERKSFSPGFKYTDQVEWEYAGLENATIIVFWVPRVIETMPAFTTNVEFGRYVGSGRAVYGRPQ